ncbi:SAM-dependent methyltransferase [Streptomyces sp. NPDC003691]
MIVDGVALDGNMHVGYWDSAADDRLLCQAADRLTDLVGERLVAAPGWHVLDVGCRTERPVLRIARVAGARVPGIWVATTTSASREPGPELTALTDQVVFRYADACTLPIETAPLRRCLCDRAHERTSTAGPPPSLRSSLPTEGASGKFDQLSFTWCVIGVMSGFSIRREPQVRGLSAY